MQLKIASILALVRQSAILAIFLGLALDWSLGYKYKACVGKLISLYQVRLINCNSQIYAESPKTFPSAPGAPLPLGGLNDKSFTRHDISTFNFIHGSTPLTLCEYGRTAVRPYIPHAKSNSKISAPESVLMLSDSA